MKEYFNRLDSLRFLAFFLVLVGHLSYFLKFPTSVFNYGTLAFTYLQNGDLGVAFFFVLSGFLITYLLERERIKTGSISLKNFYIRRVLRIWPLYFLAIGIVILVSFSFRGFDFYKIYIDWSEILHYLFFVGNFFKVFEHTSNEMLGVFWSIAVEEQFYIVWPIIFIIFRKRITYVLSLGVIISMIFRYHYANNFEAREFYTFSVMIYLMVGSFAGIYGERIKTWIQKNSRAILFISVSGFLALLSVRGFSFSNFYPPLFIAIDGLLFAILFSLIILVSAFGNISPNKRSKFLSATEYLGTISYGLYIYHIIALTLVLNIINKLGFNYRDLNLLKFLLIFASVFVFVIIISSFSYKLIEKPFLKLKERWFYGIKSSHDNIEK